MYKLDEKIPRGVLATEWSCFDIYTVGLVRITPIDRMEQANPLYNHTNYSQVVLF